MRAYSAQIPRVDASAVNRRGEEDRVVERDVPAIDFAGELGYQHLFDATYELNQILFSLVWVCTLVRKAVASSTS